VVVPAVAEVRAGDPAAAVLENARRKARAGRLIQAGRTPTLGVDTDVAIDGRLLGKPADEAEARAHLTLLSGRTHEVLSGLSLLEPTPEGGVSERSALARTTVTFRALEQPVIGLYLSSGEWRDRAGGYAIQGLGSILIASIEGDFSNVVGLPVAALLRLMPGLMVDAEH
jgi:septum formation protein